jgi:hypothetical protein
MHDTRRLHSNKCGKPSSTSYSVSRPSPTSVKLALGPSIEGTTRKSCRSCKAKHDRQKAGEQVYRSPPSAAGAPVFTVERLGAILFPAKNAKSDQINHNCPKQHQADLRQNLCQVFTLGGNKSNRINNWS